MTREVCHCSALFCSAKLGTSLPRAPSPLCSHSCGVSVLSPLACDVHSRSCLSNVFYWSGGGDLTSSPWSLCHQHLGVLGHLSLRVPAVPWSTRCCSPHTQNKCTSCTAGPCRAPAGCRSTGQCCWLGSSASARPVCSPPSH